MLEAPRGLSHPQTSFIGTVCQGIHHTPFRAAHAPKNPNDSFKRQTTNHHTVKNDHKTIDLETRLIQKRRAWRNRDKANDDITSSHCSRPLSSSQTTTRPDRTRPAAHRPTASRQGHPENRTHPKRMRVAVREPKSISAPLPAGPKDPRSQRSLPHQHAHAKTETIPGAWATRRTPDRRPEKLRRKEVIQPHLPIRLPCYDFTPVIGPAFGSSFFAVRSLTSGVTDSHGVTGGVYKTRERIHRDILIRDY